MHSTFNVHAAVVRPQPGKERLNPAAAMWAAMCQLHRELAKLPPDGIQATETQSGVAVRWAGAVAESFLAVEVIDLDTFDAWEAFVIPLPDGELRTGWRRRGHAADQPPDVWVAAVVETELGSTVQCGTEPHFLALVAAFCSETTPTIGYSEQHARFALASEMEHLRKLSSSQAATIRALRGALQARPASVATDASTATPPRSATLEDIGAWAEENADRITILPRAIAAARKSLYQDPERVYAALVMLAGTYRLVKESLLPRERLKEEADALGMLIGGSVDPSRAGMAGSEYFVSYGGRRRFLDQHVGSGSSRDPRFSMRIYYTWDEETKKVLVGYLPGHLSNSKS